MYAFNFKAFLSEFSISADFAARVFGISRRTVFNWSKNGQISGPALQVARTIALQSAPWNLTMRRHISAGASALPWEWRVHLFGADWHAGARAASEAVAARRYGAWLADQKGIEARRSKMQQRAAQALSARGKKGATTRAARTASAVAAQREIVYALMRAGDRLAHAAQVRADPAVHGTRAQQHDQQLQRV